jgi:hypothetical protein
VFDTTQDGSGAVQNVFELLETETCTGMGDDTLHQWHGTTSVEDNDSDATQARQVLLLGSSSITCWTWFFVRI